MEINKADFSKKAMETLDKFLSMEFPKVEFTEKNRIFLVKYAILKETDRPNDILHEIQEEVTAIDTYWGQCYPNVKLANEKLRKISDRYKSVCGRDSNAFGGFVGFLNWWYEEIKEHGEHECYYCGVRESVSESVFENGMIKSKKFTGGLQIDRKNPDRGYNADNCVFSCVLCNNAKSDMISAEDYKMYFGKAVKSFWEHISNAD